MDEEEEEEEEEGERKRGCRSVVQRQGRSRLQSGLVVYYAH